MVATEFTGKRTGDVNVIKQVLNQVVERIEHIQSRRKSRSNSINFQAKEMSEAKARIRILQQKLDHEAQVDAAVMIQSLCRMFLAKSIILDASSRKQALVRQMQEQEEQRKNEASKTIQRAYKKQKEHQKQPDIHHN